jgi:glycosyltransferase involved in cell wall biosynthesis
MRAVASTPGRAVLNAVPSPWRFGHFRPLALPDTWRVRRVTGLSILHVSQPVVGGVPRCLVDLVADQVGRGWRVTVACPGGGDLAARVTAAGGDHVEWQAQRSPGATVPGETRSLARIIESVRPDLVHLHSAKAGLAGRLALRRRMPTVFQPHNWSFEAVTGLLHAASTAWERIGARWADMIVCVSEAERDVGERSGVRARWRTVPNGVDLTAFPEASDAARSAARSRLGLGPEPLAVCVGRLSRAKGQDVLLDAWPLVLSDAPRARLALVGEGEDEPLLRSRRASSVTFAGKRDDVADWLAAADVVAIPSRWEGMSLIMLEAMASGRSVVATDVAGAMEALGGEAGTVVPVEQPLALADALVERLLDPARRAAEGRAGRRRAEQAYDLRRTTEATARVYADVLDARRP